MRHQVPIGQHVLAVDGSPVMGGEDFRPSAHDSYDDAWLLPGAYRSAV
jgi:hypothetical protein